MGNGGKRREDRYRVREGGVGRFPTCTTRPNGVEGMSLREAGEGRDSGCVSAIYLSRRTEEEDATE